jgi:hypothetical protein
LYSTVSFEKQPQILRLLRFATVAQDDRDEGYGSFRS